MSEKARGREDGLLEGWGWTTIGEIYEVNPTMSYPEQLTDESSVSFVPMAAVDEFEGAITSPETRLLKKYGEAISALLKGTSFSPRLLLVWRMAKQPLPGIL